MAENTTPKKIKAKKKRKPNYILIVGIIVILIPVILLASILLTSLEKKGVPVIENRFENQLNPAITEEQLTTLSTSLTTDNVENITVNLNTGTLRVMINAADAATMDQIKAVRDEIVKQVYAILPMETYFTNQANVKMYDFELQVYNFIPEEGQTGQIHLSYVKNAAAESAIADTLTAPKDKEVADNLMNPVKPEEGK
ncbi:MAG: hypothetical protein ACRDBX_03400 [Erysipelotrichaceae bacterium]